MSGKLPAPPKLSDRPPAGAPTPAPPHPPASSTPSASGGAPALPKLENLPSWVADLQDPGIAVHRWRRVAMGGGALAVLLAVLVPSIVWLKRVLPAHKVHHAAPAAVAVSQPRAPREPVAAAMNGEALRRERTLALKHYQEGRFREAAAAYERATQLDPTHAGAFAGLGAARARAGDVAGAVVAYREAIRLQPEHSGFRAALGRVYREAGQEDAARAEYKKALELDPENQAASRASRELAHR